MKEFSYSRVVRKYEVDSTGLLQVSNYFRYMEECECAFLRSLGLSFFDENDDTVFPRVSTNCQVFSPTRCGDQIVIYATLEKLSRSSMVFLFDFFQEEKDGRRQVVAEGKLSIVACTYDGVKKQLRSVPIKDKMRSKIVEYMSTDCEKERVANE